MTNSSNTRVHCVNLFLFNRQGERYKEDKGDEQVYEEDKNIEIKQDMVIMNKKKKINKEKEKERI